MTTTTPRNGRPSTVYVIDDDASTRDALEQLIRPTGYRIESYDSAESFLQNYQPDQPHCLLVDERLPGMLGSDLLRQLHADGHAPPAVFVTGYPTTATTVSAMRHGAVNVLEKPCSEADLRQSVEEALDKSQRTLAESDTRKAAVERLAHLTDVERDVLTQVLEGVPNKQIAKNQQVCVRTVEARRSRIYKAMEVGSVAELARVCVQVGFPRP